MGEAPLSLHLDAESMAKLESEARARAVTSDDLARSVIEDHLEIQGLEREILAQHLREADEGAFISEEARPRREDIAKEL